MNIKINHDCPSHKMTAFEIRAKIAENVRAREEKRAPKTQDFWAMLEAEIPSLRMEPLHEKLRREAARSMDFDAWRSRNFSVRMDD